MSNLPGPIPPVPADWCKLELGEGGRSLIEASAGTGKTWTIAVLYLRLLLERGLSPRQVVVTTFTEAAAQELRERLRGKLQWALLHAETDIAPCASVGADDEFWLRDRWQKNESIRAQDRASLLVALAELDVAPISTLHGLCRRILSDYPFACGVPFVLGDMVASESLLDEVAEDQWRTLQQGDDSAALVLLRNAMPLDLSLDALKKGLKLCLAPGVGVAVKSDEELEQVLPGEWAARLRATVANDELFTASCPLRKYWAELADLIDDHSALPRTKHTSNGLLNATKLTGISAKGKRSDEIQEAASFSSGCAWIIEYLRGHSRLAFWSAISEAARVQVENRLLARNQFTFDELLTTVHSALGAESNGVRPLADALFAAWPVALVDEFQDTDGIQYGILDAIYRGADRQKRGRLVMIGDPKQAIYSFRGGDIHAYQRAKDEADLAERMTLGTNHRSSAELVEAFNKFYEVAGTALTTTESVDSILYETVAPSKRRAAERYSIGGVECSQPLVIHYQDQCPPAAAHRRANALEICANQIASMLQSGEHEIGGIPVQPSDIAVLLPTGANIESLRDQLRLRGVPCVTSTRTSVFATDVARDLQVVLYAVAHPTELGPMRAAAATRLWGASFHDLQVWSDDPQRWQAVAQQFHDWHHQWKLCGVQSFVDLLIGHMQSRYLATIGGERAITDLRHLGELLQEQSESLAGSEELLAWFNERRSSNASSDDDAGEAAQLRIESDSARVRLMTLHASKGLEFPIVFLPLMWNHGERPGGGISILSDVDSGTRTAEVSDNAGEREKQELQDERFRVLYVALTRAIHTCHVFALSPDRVKDAGSKSPAVGTARSALDVMLGRLPASLLSAELMQLTPQIEWRDGWGPTEKQDFVDTKYDAAQSRMFRAMPRRPAGPLPAKHSFTTLTQWGGRPAIDPEASASDEAPTSVVDDGMDLVEDATQLNDTRTDDGILSASAGTLDIDLSLNNAHPTLQAIAAVRGADFGNAVHAIFEHRQVGVALSDQRTLIEHWLRDAGVRRKDIEQALLVDALVERIQAALEAPLGAATAPTVCLADVPAHDLLAEMEFHFPLHRVSLTRLRDACALHGEPDLVPRNGSSLSGLMTGKIDLIFHHAGRYYVLDYKGNYLGDTVADYQGKALRSRMDDSHYRFQALLYTVAVDRYLRQRMGDAYDRSQHLGECFYLFIRAAGLAPDAGIWRHRYPDALLDEVAGVFTDSTIVEEAA